MPKNCIQPDLNRRQFGFNKRIVDQFRQWTGKNRLAKADVRGIARNLGVDDERILDIQYNTRQGNQKRLFGENEAPIQEYDSSAGSVPKDVLVKSTNKNGRVEYFISNKKTSKEPTRWVTDKTRITKNPDWEQVNQNATIDESGAFRLYKRSVGDDGEIIYRPAEPGEDGVFLNIQNPVRDENVTAQQIKANNIDAIELEDGYKLIDEDSQVIPPKKATEKPTGEATQTRRTTDKPSDQQIEDAAKQSLGSEVARAVPKGALGALVGDAFDGEGHDGMWWGGAAGLLLGMPRVRTSMKGVFNTARRQGEDIYEKIGWATKQAEDEVEEATRDRNIFEFSGDLDDAEEVDVFRSTVREPLEQKIDEGASGKEVEDHILNNGWTQTAFQFLSNLGSKTAKQLRDVLVGLPSSEGRLIGKFRDEINKRYPVDGGFSGRAWEKAEEDAISFTREFLDEKGFASDPQSAREFFGQAIRRTTLGKTTLEGGQLSFDEANDIIAREYESGVKREFDRRLLQSDLKAVKDAWDEVQTTVRNEFVESYQKQIDDYLPEVSPAYRGLMEQFTQSNQFFKDWKQGLSFTARNMLRTAQKEEEKVIKKIVDAKQAQMRVNHWAGRYYPEMLDQQKLGAYREEKLAQYRQGEGLGSLEAERFRSHLDEGKSLEEAAERTFKFHMANMFYKYNRGKEKINGLIEETWDGADYKYKTFNSVEKAERYLRNDLAERLPSDQRQQMFEILNGRDTSIRDFIVTDNVVQGDNIRTIYRLTNPDQLKRQGIDLFEDVNRHHFESIFDMYSTNNFLKHSDHLDRPRFMHIPDRVARRDVFEVTDRYSRDAGRRLHMLKNGIVDNDDLQLRYLNDIYDEVKGKMKNPDEQWPKMAGRIKTAYKMQNRLAHWYKVGDQSAEEFAAKNRTEKILGAFRNLNLSAFLHYIPLYGLFQPLTMTPILASYDSVGKTYKTFFRNKDALKAAEGYMHRNNVITREVKSMSPEIFDIEQTTSSYKQTTADKLFNKAKGLTEFVGHWSIPRWVSENALGLDFDNAGMARLAGDSAYGVTSVETTINFHAGLYEAKKQADLYNKLMQLPEGQRQIRGRFDSAGNFKETSAGSVFRIGDVKKKLTELGIPESRIPQFADKNRQLDEVMDNFNKGKDVTSTIDEELQEDIHNIASVMTDSYHGRNKMFRPENFGSNPWARLGFQFATHPVNFGMQVTKRRMFDPIQNWLKKYKGQDVKLVKLMNDIRKGDEEKLRKALGPNWRQAVDEFPSEAFHNIAMGLPIMMGVGKAMLMTKSGLQDFIDMSMNYMTGDQNDEEWSRLNREFAINPSSRNPIPMSEALSDGPDGHEIFRIGMQGFRTLSEVGSFGKYTQLIDQSARFHTDGVLGLTPAGGALNDWIIGTAKAGAKSMEEGDARHLGKQVFDNIMGRMPGLAPYRGMYSPVGEYLFEEETETEFVDEESGNQLFNTQPVIE